VKKNKCKTNCPKCKTIYLLNLACTWSEGDQAVGSIVHVLGLIEADGRVNEMFSCSCIHQRDILVPCKGGEPWVSKFWHHITPEVIHREIELPLSGAQYKPEPYGNTWKK